MKRYVMTVEFEVTDVDELRKAAMEEYPDHQLGQVTPEMHLHYLCFPQGLPDCVRPVDGSIVELN